MADTDEVPLFEEAVSWEEAQRLLAEAGMGDGLPLVPPTRRRLDVMLAGLRDPDRSYGLVPPLFGDLTPRAVAYSCVLAGCEPAELPVVLSAVEACLDDPFNLLGIQTTTGTPTVAVVVHGPAAGNLGMNSRTNCLGPGNRVNACIGRAVQLTLVNIGGARPEVGDMATMGQPGKYTFCFAEADDPLIPPLHVRRELRPEQNAVTVLGVSGTAEVLPADERDSPESILRPLVVAMKTARRLGGPAMARRPPGEQFFLLPPELSALIAKHGWGLGDIQQFIFNEKLAIVCGSDGGGQGETPDCPVAASAEDIHPIVTGGAGVKMTYLPLWMGGTRSITTAILDL